MQINTLLCRRAVTKREAGLHQSTYWRHAMPQELIVAVAEAGISNEEGTEEDEVETAEPQHARASSSRK